MPDAARLRLLLNGHDVGAVSVAHHDNGWQFGVFEPNDQFQQFAPVFSLWSNFLHLPLERASPREADDWARCLRSIEQAVDRIRAELLFPQTGQRRRISQVNIDPPLVEWLADTPGDGGRQPAGALGDEHDRGSR